MKDGVVDKLLLSFERFYDVRKDCIEAPFCAEAEFHSHSEQYFLVKEAKLAEADSNEFVFFCNFTELGVELLKETALKAWETGLSRVVVGSGHRNSDISLIILSEKIEENAFKQAKKIKFYKSYKFGFWGYSHFKLIAAEISSGRLAFNRFGSDYKKILNNIL